jgi:hypothetical protein
MAKVKVIGIKWEADDIDDVSDLSTEMILDIPDNVIIEGDLEDFIEDELSNQSGFTHLGWSKHEILASNK